jgi:uncharacterized protein (TIGR01777 family)
LNILITGSTGLIGSELASLLKKNHHRIVRLVRKAPTGSDEVRWDPSTGIPDKASIEGLDAVIHLAGENIAASRWTKEQKKRIEESRIQGTQLLAQSLSHLFDPPKVLISVSAVGYYGDRGDTKLNETSPPGSGFLAGLCREWEAATAPASRRNIRVVHPRLGMVLSAAGGSLAKMLPPFRMGIGGRIGSGKQYISWIAIDDLVRIIEYAIQDESFRGPVNAVAPYPVTNSEFSEILGRLLHRPSFMALPAFAARLLWGQLADEVLLASARVSPERLLQSHYKFLYPTLEAALQHILYPTSSQEHSKGKSSAAQN